MKKILLLAIIIFELFAHSDHIQVNNMDSNNTNTQFDYGGYVNLSYRTDDLYPNGVENSYSYENHGEKDKLFAEHVGLYFNYMEDFYKISSEFNHHYDADVTFNELIEKLNILFYNQNYSLKIGRDYNNLSLINKQPWGYGFISMPLSIDSFFGQTHIGDGLFFDVTNDSLSIGFDILQDKFTNSLRMNARTIFAYQDYDFYAYIHKREGSEFLNDTTSSTHSHSHGSVSCNDISNITTEDICITTDDQRVFGFGFKTDIQEYQFLTEYSNYKSKNSLNNSNYKINNDVKIQSTFLQIKSQNQIINYGLRAEYFWFDTLLKGSGANVIAEKLGKENSTENMQYLYTANLNYTFLKIQNIALEYKKSNENESISLNLSFGF